jgi:hypothetical protein
MLQNLGQELAQAQGRPVDLATFSKNLAALGKDGEGARLFTSLQVLAARSQLGDRLTDKEFVEAGRITGEIFKGHMR